MAMRFQELARQGDPTHGDTIDVRPIEDFFETRDRGTPDGGRNVRAFFGVSKKERAIIAPGAIEKQNNVQTPMGDKVRMGRRWRKYLNGDHGTIPLG